MARVTVEDCLKNVDSRFTLVHLAVRRVLQLRSGAPLTMENTRGNKEVVTALREIAAQSITVDNIRQIDESTPITPPEPVVPDIGAAVDLREIMDEATSFAPTVEYGGSESEPEFGEQDTDQESGQDEEGI